MTLSEAKQMLMFGSLKDIYLKKPAGASLRQIFLDCISISQGDELDTMVKNCLQLERRTAFYMWGSNLPTETDVEFRQRAEDYAYILDKFEREEETPKECYHSWKFYQGILEQYHYCEFCDLKRNK